MVYNLKILNNNDIKNEFFQQEDQVVQSRR